ncbi:MAG: carbohydrate ABC transporter permease [Sphaerochaeta sp.]|uniref:carbohydrate ABC transporter permease n=1 Tax=Sphaerochaeta sp. TaxID=1972642 RepID=UPI0029766540|nr:carbohydrate ABC transporter permease [Sphaerochaeta sp.]MDD3929523.1 carbohydrate ABC transporter permease [Sphaerochaeta sp.]
MKKHILQRTLSKLLIYTVLTLVFIVAIFPVLYTLLGSFKGNMELLTEGNRLFPRKFVLDNYKQAWQIANFSQYTLNSLFMSGSIVLGTIISCTIAGYVFERGHFKGKNLIFTLVVSSMFVSLGSLTLYPVFMIAKFFGINKSLWGVIIIRVFGLNVTNLFIARAYIRTISYEIDESAMLDGCSFFQIYHTMILPLLKPLVATIAILEFRHSWNDYLMPLVFTLSNPKRMPLIVGIMELKSSGEAATSWNLMLAGSSIALIPMIVVYLIFNRNFIEGLTAGSVKG